MELKALKTFSRGGAELTRLGTTFNANDKHAEEYIRLKLAEPTTTEDQATTANINTVGAGGTRTRGTKDRLHRGRIKRKKFN